MKYRKNGRTYRLVRERGCRGCAFWSNELTFDDNKDCKDSPSCFEINGGGGIWRETLFSKIRNWRKS